MEPACGERKAARRASLNAVRLSLTGPLLKQAAFEISLSFSGLDCRGQPTRSRAFCRRLPFGTDRTDDPALRPVSPMFLIVTCALARARCSFGPLFSALVFNPF